MGTSIDASGGGIRAKIRRALGALKHKDGSYGDLSLSGQGELWVKDIQLSELITLVQAGLTVTTPSDEAVRTEIEKLSELLKTISDVDTVKGAAAISHTTDITNKHPDKKWRLKYFSVTFSTAPTTSQSITVTKSPKDTNRPATILFSQNPSLTAATSILQIWEDGVAMSPGDEVVIAYTNTDTRTIEAEIGVEIINE